MFELLKENTSLAIMFMCGFLIGTVLTSYIMRIQQDKEITEYNLYISNIQAECRDKIAEILKIK